MENKKSLLIIFIIIILVGIIGFLLFNLGGTSTVSKNDLNGIPQKIVNDEIESENDEIESEKDNLENKVIDTSINKTFTRYRIKDGIVYYVRSIIKDADALTFQELNSDWAKDTNGVYSGSKLVRGIDSETVKVLQSDNVNIIYISDKNGVWYSSSTSKRNRISSDPLNFLYISNGFSKDKNNIYWRGEKIEDADVETFEVITVEDLFDDGYGTGFSRYSKDKNNVYRDSLILEGADVQSFISLGDDYAKDNDTLYFGDEPFLIGDLKSFEIMAYRYSKDKNNVYVDGEILDLEIDPASFSVIGSGVFKDNYRVYSLDDTVYYTLGDAPTYKTLDVDAPTFEHIGTCSFFERSSGSYYKDKNNIYAGFKPIDEIDLASFYYFGIYSGVSGQIPHGTSYAKDANNIYHSCGAVLENADLSSFEDLSDGFAKDKDAVWYLARVIDDADSRTFRVLGEGYSEDKENVYFTSNVMEEVDLDTFELVIKEVAEGEYKQPVYAKDKNNVYGYGEIIKKAAPENCTSTSIMNCNPK